MKLKELPEEQLHKELRDLNEYYDREQTHLTLRISKSLRLLKQMLPSDIPAQPELLKKGRLVFTEQPKCHVVVVTVVVDEYKHGLTVPKTHIALSTAGLGVWCTPCCW